MLSNLAIQYVTATGLFPSFVKRSVLIRELARWVCRHCESTTLAGQSAESSARCRRRSLRRRVWAEGVVTGKTQCPGETKFLRDNSLVAGARFELTTSGVCISF